MRFKKIMNIFDNGNTCVSGLRGSGKDVIMGNVIMRRKKPYMSNTDYGGEHYPLDLQALQLSGNTYKDFINGTVKKYVWEYPEECDIYISDAGVIFPSQYNGELNKLYGGIPIFCALSRQIASLNVHYNSQAQKRVWDKFREQSDQYIVCRNCLFIGKIVILSGTIYDNEDSAQQKRRPLKLPRRKLFDKTYSLQYETAKANFQAQHGDIKDFTTIFWNKSKHNTRIFKEILENGKETKTA